MRGQAASQQESLSLGGLGLSQVCIMPLLSSPPAAVSFLTCVCAWPFVVFARAARSQDSGFGDFKSQSMQSQDYDPMYASQDAESAAQHLEAFSAD